MKNFYTLSIFMLSFSTAIADDQYTNNLYTSVTLLYWCTYKEVPTSKQEITTVINVNDSNPNISIKLDDWLKSLSYEINGDELTIINKSVVISDGKNQSTLISKSSTNCN